VTDQQITKVSVTELCKQSKTLMIESKFLE